MPGEGHIVAAPYRLPPRRWAPLLEGGKSYTDDNLCRAAPSNPVVTRSLQGCSQRLHRTTATPCTPTPRGRPGPSAVPSDCRKPIQGASVASQAHEQHPPTRCAPPPHQSLSSPPPASLPPRCSRPAGTVVPHFTATRNVLVSSKSRNPPVTEQAPCPQLCPPFPPTTHRPPP